LILSGAGRYADPWHPYDLTSDRLAQVLRTEGLEVEISGEVDARMATLGAELPDLLVVNIGDPALNYPDKPAPSEEAHGREGLLAYLASGRPLLGVHTASTSLHGVSEWKSILGGVWVRGQSFHPDYGTLPVTVATSGLTQGLTDFVVTDELYSDLSLQPDNVVIAWNQSDPVTRPLVWQRTYGPTGSRVLYDALGHDTAAYESDAHQQLLRRGVRWLLG
jgi:type 1 glutamine amidotransferase